MKWLVFLVIVVFIFVFAKPYLQDMVFDREQMNEATTVHIDVNVDIDESWYNKTDVHHPNVEATATTADKETTEATTTAAATEAVTTEATETVTEATTENQSTESITAGCDHKHTQGVDEPTCETGGYEGKVICKDCGAVLEEGKKVDALGHKFDGEYVGYDGPNDVEKVWCSYGCGAKITREIPDLQVRVKPLEDGFIFIITGGLHPEAKVYVDGIEMKTSHISHSRYEYSGFVTYEDLDGKGFEVRAYDVSENRKAVVSYTAEGEVIG